jgi:hypothetical protein
MGVLHHSASRDHGPVTDDFESPRELWRQSTPSIRLGWGLLAVVGLGGIVFALINSKPPIGFAGAIFLSALLYWEARSSSPMLPQPVPLAQFQWCESVDPLSLLCLERHAVLLPARFDPGAMLQSDAGTRRFFAVHPVDVSAVALVGWTS